MPILNSKFNLSKKTAWRHNKNTREQKVGSKYQYIDQIVQIIGTITNQIFFIQIHFSKQD